MSDAPIFIVGTERSGSNLLRLLLDAHPRITVPHPPHLVRFFTPLRARYGDLSDDTAFARLVDDMLAVLRVHINPWEVPIDRARILRDARPRDAFGIYTCLQEQYREASGKARWGCKSTFMIDHVPQIVERYPDARLILLVRDPRDVAASSRVSVFSTFHPWNTAHLWRDQQLTGLRWLDALPPTQIHLLRYEELVREPEAALRRLCAFLEEAFVPGMLAFFEGAEARKSARLAESWARTGQPVDAASVARFRAELSDAELRWVEAVCRAPMRRLGYATVHDDATLDASAPTRLDRARIRVEESRLSLAVELRSLRKDRNIHRRWTRAALLAWLRVRP